MSGPSPASGGNNPFENLFGDLARLLGGAGGPLNWDVARQVALVIAGEGSTHHNVDPMDRIRLEELARVAELHVTQATGFSAVPRTVDAVSPVAWAARTLDDWRPVLENLAIALGRKPDMPSEEADPLAEAGAQMFAQMEQWIGPVLLGMQAGGMVGHLGKRSLGFLDFPIPRPAGDSIVLVPANIKAFSDDWSLPLDELSLYVAIEEVTRFAILSRPHVRKRFDDLLNEYVSEFRPDPSALEDQLGQLDMTDPTQLPAALTNPQALLGAMQTPEQQQTLARLSALVSAFVGYVDYVTGQIAGRTIASSSAIAEAVKRRRVEESDGQRLVERLLGLELSQPTFDRGDAFIRGICERAGDTGLARLWNSERELPTPAEVDAPGLWLERIDLPTED